MSLQLKPGVRLKGLTTQALLGVVIVHAVFVGYKTKCVITSGSDSKHKVGSKHGDGNAFDVRTKTFLGDKIKLTAEIQDALGMEFDVVLEHLGEVHEHIHVEYDPK